MRDTVFFGGVISSCSDDDEGAGGSARPPKENLELTTPDGKQIKLVSNGEYSITYNDEGLPTLMAGRYGYSNVEFSYNPMRFRYTGDDYDGEEIVYTVTLNAKGYVSKIHCDYSFNYDDGWEKGSGDFLCSYNAADQLSGITLANNFSGVEDGDRYSYSSKRNARVSYDGNKIAKVEIREEENEDGDIETSHDVFTYDYSTVCPNVLGQFSHSLQKTLFWELDELSYMSMIGLMGKPSVQFPSSVRHEQEWAYDGQEYSNTNTYNASYTFGSDGRLKRERYSYGSYDYVYSDEANGSSVKAKAAPASVKPLCGLMKSHRARRAHKQAR